MRFGAALLVLGAMGCDPDVVESVTGPVPLTSDEMLSAFDPSTGDHVLFGGVSEGREHQRTWIYRHGRYEAVETVGPRWVKRAPGAVDASRQRAYFFGGVDRRGRVRRDLFFFDRAKQTWHFYQVEDGFEWPSRRYGATLLYDAPRDRLLMWGGFDGSSRPVEPDVIWSFTETRGWTPL